MLTKGLKQNENQKEHKRAHHKTDWENVIKFKSLVLQSQIPGTTYSTDWIQEIKNLEFKWLSAHI